MKTVYDPYAKLNTETVIALGCFDGVHIAHRAVIEEAVRVARELGLTPAVWCFSEPPKNAYSKEPVPLITDAKEKERLIGELGVQILITPDFDERIKAVDAESFIIDILCERAGAAHLVCGKNYTFGAGGTGNAEFLRSVCKREGVGISIVDDVAIDGENVSSTRIREAIGEGRCRYASSLLGRDFSAALEPVPSRKGVFSLPKKYLFVPDGSYEVALKSGSGTQNKIARVWSDGQYSYVSFEPPADFNRTVTVCFSNGESLSASNQK